MIIKIIVIALFLFFFQLFQKKEIWVVPTWHSPADFAPSSHHLIRGCSLSSGIHKPSYWKTYIQTTTTTNEGMLTLFQSNTQEV